MIQLGERAPGFLTDGDIGSSFRKLCSLTRTSYVLYRKDCFRNLVFFD